MKRIVIFVICMLVTGCGAGQDEPDFKAGGAQVYCEPTPCK